MMETQEILRLLQSYFDGNTTEAEEQQLNAYFQSGEVAEELTEYTEFFGGISELAGAADDPTIEDDVMDYILENEHRDKTKYRTMWKAVTGIAASVIIVLGGFLFYQEQQKPFDDTFKNPEEAYAYAAKTLQFVGNKYNEGLAHLSEFEKLRKGNEPVKKATQPVVDFYEGIERMEATEASKPLQDVDSL
ncbi:hypothetical protein SLH46_07970 [Draconibacterium sp. IB214405]|uniref:hypothetical protein n=1 Tax=Draconibacterium sp. IB214405 TaxID=3097352 RepID=UPI002A11DD2E|nr:hypothetical protein [Draconibacterium sp. IB214405]MDX8339110.1 hypothetical protein [Draconibacterium sp. IB214405]